jgi:hypothetical protein
MPCLTFANFVESAPETVLVLRHDVDKRPENGKGRKEQGEGKREKECEL